jgi:MaoC like domain
MPERLGRVELTDVVRYAGASGDLNPIHYDPSYARAAGHEGLFAMGALHGGWLVSHLVSLGASVPEQAPSFVRLRFHGIVPLGLDLAAEATVGPDRSTAELTGGGDRKASVELGPLDAAPAAGAGRDEQRCSFPVELGTAKRFGEAVRWPRPMAPGGPTPPTYLSVLSFWLPDPDPINRVGFDRGRTLLGEVSIQMSRGPVRVGEVFDVREYVGPERARDGRAGRMRLVDLVAELSDEAGLRVVYRNTFILMPARAAGAARATGAAGVAGVAGVAPLTGSRDAETGQTFYPARARSVDGRLRTLDETTLATEGVLYSWTTCAGTAYGQVDLDDGVRLQVRLAPGEHRIGARYRLAAAPDGDRWFTRA